MKVKIFFLTGMIFLFILTGFANEKPADPADSKAPLISVPNPTYKFDSILEGKEILHDFKVKNNGNAMLEITKVKPG